LLRSPGREDYNERTDFFMAPGAPTPVAPFSHAVEVDGWIFVTGQMPTYPDDDSRPLAPNIESQTVRVMENLKIVLAGLKLGWNT